MNYRRILAIDEQIEDLERIKDAVIKGSKYNNALGLTSESYAYLHIRVKHKTVGISWNDELKYKFFSKWAIQMIEDEIKELKEEKSIILNRKWWQFWL